MRSRTTTSVMMCRTWLCDNSPVRERSSDSLRYPLRRRVDTTTTTTTPSPYGYYGYDCYHTLWRDKVFFFFFLGGGLGKGLCNGVARGLCRYVQGCARSCASFLDDNFSTPSRI